MLEIYSYEYVTAAIAERRTKALNRYERLHRRIDERGIVAVHDAQVVEIAFANGCPEPDQISA